MALVEFHFPLHVTVDGKPASRLILIGRPPAAWGRNPNTSLLWVVVLFFLSLNLFVGRRQHCFSGKSDEIITAEVQYIHGITFYEQLFQGLHEAMLYLGHIE